VVREHHELYGVLNGIASARAATLRTPKMLDGLLTMLDALRAGKESRTFQETAWRYRKTVNDEYAGPRLQAAIRASQTLMPRTFWTAYQNSHGELLRYYEAETVAISDRDPVAARSACVDRAEAMGRIMLTELVRRRVLAPPAASPHEPSVAF
jgi:DNA-binding GntR family transcriptional regulator